jgi:hypothetical protein
MEYGINDLCEEEYIMNHFAQGVLTVSEETYIGEPDLRLVNGKTIRLLYEDLRTEGYEEEDLLSLLLEENKWYELLLLVMIGLGERTITIAPTIPPGTEMELKYLALLPDRYPDSRYNWVMQGIILDPQWDAASQPYLAVNGPLVFTHRWVLIQTAVGKMVLSYSDLEKRLGDQVKQLAPGAYLEWGPARLDILAIIAKRDPAPGE